MLFAQSRTRINLDRAEHATGAPKQGVSYLRKPVFSHDGAILSCDSAILYSEKNRFEAFGNVRINQGDTLNIYSEFLNYDGNAKKAHLDQNVKLVDRENTLTTNVLDYDMVAKIGEYKDGGKLVNKDATITSKTGFYFSKTRDAYFKIDVLVVTNQSTITSENLRYNTGTNWTYFYGPTNIKSKEDNLYTENGAYNTKSENAYFGKKNRYTNGSRTLKGDSLYYFGKQGYGKAVKNIIFTDSKDQTLIRGQLGEYFRGDEKVRVTKKAYVAIGTDDSITVNQKKIPDTLWLGADTLESERALISKLQLLEKPVVKKDNEIGTESNIKQQEKAKEKAEARKLLAKASTENARSTETQKTNHQKKKRTKEEPSQTEELSAKIHSDSLLRAQQKLKKDSLLTDSLFRLKKLMENAKVDSIKTKKIISNSKQDKVQAETNHSAKDSLAKKIITKIDSTKTPLDTARARIIKAFHNVRLYKSNMQARADSLFYSAADSTLRWYKNPILWSDGNQQTGDTIHVFFKNKKIYAFQVLHNGFLVNIDGDSTKFNQVKGKTMTGFFTQGELRNMYIDGNAESIYYSKNEKGEYDNVNQTVSSRLRFKFADKELTHLVTVREVEGAVNPIDKLEKEAILSGFIWKPELRPLNKKEVISGEIRQKLTNTEVKTASNTDTSPEKKVDRSTKVNPILQVKPKTKK
jgi:lipopolysaccharide export system protein LptA